MLALALALVHVAWLCAPVCRWWWVLAPLVSAACGGWWWVLVLALVDVCSHWWWVPGPVRVTSLGAHVRHWWGWCWALTPICAPHGVLTPVRGTVVACPLVPTTFMINYSQLPARRFDHCLGFYETNT